MRRAVAFVAALALSCGGGEASRAPGAPPHVQRKITLSDTFEAHQVEAWHDAVERIRDATGLIIPLVIGECEHSAYDETSCAYPAEDLGRPEDGERRIVGTYYGGATDDIAILDDLEGEFLSHVIVHELFHWLGVGHAGEDDEPTLMRPYAGTCIGEWEIVKACARNACTRLEPECV